jgi:hypothetical protein
MTDPGRLALMARPLVFVLTVAVALGGCRDANQIYRLWFDNRSGQELIAQIVGSYGDERRTIASYSVRDTPRRLEIEPLRRAALGEGLSALHLVIFDTDCRHIETNELVGGLRLVTLEEDDAIRLTLAPVELDDDGDLPVSDRVCDLPEGWPFVF